MHIGRPWGRDIPSELGIAAPVRRPRPLFLVATDHRFGTVEPIVAIGVAQVFLAKLTAGRVGQRIDELDRVGQPPFGDLVRQIGTDVLGADVAVVVADDKKQRPLVPLGMWYADRRGLGDAWTADSGILKLDRAD